MNEFLLIVAALITTLKSVIGTINQIGYATKTLCIVTMCVCVVKSVFTPNVLVK